MVMLTADKHVKVRSVYHSLQSSSETCLFHVVKKAISCVLYMICQCIIFPCGQSACISLGRVSVCLAKVMVNGVVHGHH